MTVRVCREVPSAPSRGGISGYCCCIETRTAYDKHDPGIASVALAPRGLRAGVPLPNPGLHLLFCCFLGGGRTRFSANGGPGQPHFPQRKLSAGQFTQSLPRAFLQGRPPNYVACGPGRHVTLHSSVAARALLGRDFNGAAHRPVELSPGLSLAGWFQCTSDISVKVFCEGHARRG